MTKLQRLCRICLNKSNKMFSLDWSFNQTTNVLGALEKVTSCIINFEKHPKVICPSCMDHLKIAHNLILQFEESENILRKHFNNSSKPKPSTNNTWNNEENGRSSSLSAVELIVGCNKYNLNDIFVVESKENKQHDFKGFLGNLGKTISANYANKSKSGQNVKNIEEPVVFIEKVNKNLEKVGKIEPFVLNNDKRKQLKTKILKSTANSNVKLELDQYIIEFDHILPNSEQQIYKLNDCNLNKKIQYDNNTSQSLTQVSCRICLKTFNNKKLFLIHKRIHDLHEYKIRCDLCKCSFKDNNTLINHKSTKHSNKKFICEKCGAIFKSIYSLKDHSIRHNDQSKPIRICAVCGKTFTQRNGFNMHMKVHSNDRKHCCQFCNMKFYSLSNLKRHMLTHTKIKTFSCSICKKSFLSRGEVRKHRRSHGDNRNLKCDFCDKIFSSQYNLGLHYVAHSGNFQCDSCDKTFANTEGLQMHYKLKH